MSILVEKIKCSKMNKEQKIWFLTSAISGIIFMSILIMTIYDIRFKYGLYVVILAFGISYAGLIMFSMTQWISTREIVSMLSKKVREW